MATNYKVKDKEGKVYDRNFETPVDFNISDLPSAEAEMYRLFGNPEGTTIQGNLGITLIPGVNSSSESGNIQVLINGYGSLNHRAVGVAHEFGHVVLYLNGKPHGHFQPGVEEAVYDKRADVVKKRLGYDY
ncbi:hypothetical protein [Robertkochia marina]|nr:hypothetical protein [Robertkochia marina]